MGFILLLPILALAMSSLMVLTKKPPLLRGQIIYAISWLVVLAVCFIDVVYLVPDFQLTFSLMMTACVMGLCHPVLSYLATCDMTRYHGLQRPMWLVTGLPILFLILALMLSVGLTPEEKEAFVNEMAYDGHNSLHSTFMQLGRIMIYFYMGVMIVGGLVWLVWGLITKMRYKRLVSDCCASYVVIFATKDNSIILAHLLGTFGVISICIMPFFHALTSEVFIIILAVLSSVAFVINGMIVHTLSTTASSIADRVINNVAKIQDGETVVPQVNLVGKSVEVVPESVVTDAHITELAEKAKENTAETFEREQAEASEQNANVPSAEDFTEEVLEDESEEENEVITNLLPKDVVDRIRTEHMFRDPDTNLNLLAEKLHTNRTYLSQAIRAYYYTNLSGYIKDLRMEFVLHRMAITPNKELVMQELAFAAGYANIASFYKDFLNVVGCTPKQYIQQLDTK